MLMKQDKPLKEADVKSSLREISRKEVIGMFDEMAAWLAEHQVAKRGDPNRGAIYFPTEDRFCSRDTACMARTFMRQYCRTGDGAWREKAALARDYVLRAQRPTGGFPEMRGRAESDKGSTVNTAIAAANLIKAYELGLDCAARDLDALARMAPAAMAPSVRHRIRRLFHGRGTEVHPHGGGIPTGGNVP